MNKEKQPGKDSANNAKNSAKIAKGNAIYNKYLIKAAIKNKKLQFIEIK